MTAQQIADLRAERQKLYKQLRSEYPNIPQKRLKTMAYDMVQEAMKSLRQQNG